MQIDCGQKNFNIYYIFSIVWSIQGKNYELKIASISIKMNSGFIILLKNRRRKNNHFNFSSANECYHVAYVYTTFANYQKPISNIWLLDSEMHLNENTNKKTTAKFDSPLESTWTNWKKMPIASKIIQTKVANADIVCTVQWPFLSLCGFSNAKSKSLIPSNIVNNFSKHI